MSIAVLYVIVSVWVLFDVFHFIWLAKKLDLLRAESDKAFEALEQRMLYLED